MASQDILRQVANSFQFDIETLKFLGQSSNEVYRFSKDNEDFYLRLSEKPLEQIQAELDWINYLAQNDVRVSLPIKTVDNLFNVVCKENDKYLTATAFHNATGKLFNKSNPQLWGPLIFSKWGETMGRIHQLTKFYDTVGVSKRGSWKITKIENPCLHQEPYKLLLEKFINLEKTIADLPRDENAYGLIHNDFHPYNFHVDRGDITVFDFDDAIYGWFALDIGIAVAHAVWWGSPKDDRNSKNEFAKRFLNDFFNGYFKHNHLDDEWVQRIPMFIEYRNISSFFWWLDDWDGNESHLTEFQKSAIDHAVKLIQNGLPFDGCEIQMKEVNC